MTNKIFYQGVIGEAKRKNKEIQEVHVYANSSDFPGFNLVLLCAKGEFETERVPINEEMWQKIGVSMGYKFKRTSP